MSYYWKLLLFFGCSCLGLWVMGLLLQINQDTPPSHDIVILNILLPIVGTLIVLFCYVWYKGIDVEDIKSFIDKFKRKK